MKHQGVFIFLILIILVFFSSCSKPMVEQTPLIKLNESKVTSKAVEKSDSSMNIIFWHYSTGAQKATLDEIIEEFNETIGKKKNIVVKGVSQGNITDLCSELKNTINNLPDAQKKPDLFLAYADMAKEIDEHMEFLNLDRYFKKEQLGEYFDSFLSEGRFDVNRNLKIFPIIKSSEVLFINKTHWSEFASQYSLSYEDLSTWESLAKTAQKYYEYTDAKTPKLHDGKAMFSRDSLANYMIVESKSLGHSIMETKTHEFNEDFRLDIPTIKRLWENFYVPMIKGHYSLRGKFSSDSNQVNDVLMYVSSSTSINFASEYVVLENGQIKIIEIDAIMPPIFAGKARHAVQQGAGVVIVRSDEEQRNLACVEFLNWLLKDENNLKLALSYAYVPVKNKNLDFEKISEFAHAQGKNPNQNVLKTIGVTIDQIKSSELSSISKVRNGYPIRIAIKDSLETFCIDNRNEFLKRLENGESYEALVEEYTSNSKFVDFFNLLQSTLSEAANKN